jgi:CheY-like chemotaxis protein
VLDARPMSLTNVAPMPSTAEVGSERSVFIVDDDPALVEALTELLCEEGYRVEAHTVATEALARLEGGVRPDVVLLDYLMPAMNGDEFLGALERAGVDVPVMLFTAMNESRVHVPARRVRAVIRKPFDLDRLLDELARVRAA